MSRWFHPDMFVLNKSLETPAGGSSGQNHRSLMTISFSIHKNTILLIRKTTFLSWFQLKPKKQHLFGMITSNVSKKLKKPSNLFLWNHQVTVDLQGPFRSFRSCRSCPVFCQDPASRWGTSLSSGWLLFKLFHNPCSGPITGAPYKRVPAETFQQSSETFAYCSASGSVHVSPGGSEDLDQELQWGTGICFCPVLRGEILLTLIMLEFKLNSVTYKPKRETKVLFRSFLVPHQTASGCRTSLLFRFSSGAAGWVSVQVIVLSSPGSTV